MKRDKYDIVFSKLIRSLAGHRCEYCKKADGQIDCAHIFGRRHRHTRWDVDNAVALCRYHHRYFSENPVLFFDWLSAYLGDERLDALRLKAHQVKKWTSAEKTDLYSYLKAELEKVESIDV